MASEIENEVFAICNKLYSANEKISTRIILNLLPNIKSTSTIHTYFTQWKDNLEKEQSFLIEKLGFSSNFTKAFSAEIARYTLESENKYKEIALSAKEQTAHAVDDLATMESLVTKKDDQLSQLKIELNNINQQLNLSVSKLSDHKIETTKKIDSLNNEIKIRQKTINDLNIEIAKNQLIGEQHTIAIQSLNKQSSIKTEQDKTIAVLESKLASITDQLTEYKARDKEKSITENKLRNELSATNKDAQSLLDSNKELINSLESMTIKQDQIIGELMINKHDIENLRKENNKLSSLSDSQKMQLSSIDAMYKQSLSTIKHLEKVIANRPTTTKKVLPAKSK